MRPMLRLVGISAIALIISIGVGAPLSPHAGQEMREIKALSAQKIDNFPNARGMALAIAAGLNGYQGPLYTIEMAADLGLWPYA